MQPELFVFSAMLLGKPPVCLNAEVTSRPVRTNLSFQTAIEW